MYLAHEKKTVAAYHITAGVTRGDLNSMVDGGSFFQRGSLSQFGFFRASDQQNERSDISTFHSFALPGGGVRCKWQRIFCRLSSQFA